MVFDVFQCVANSICYNLFVCYVCFRIVASIVTWAERISWVELMHCALRDDQDAQKKMATWMCDHFPMLKQSELAFMSFPDVLKRNKDYFNHIPRKLMSPSLVAFLEKMLNYLSAGVVLGVSCWACHGLYWLVCGHSGHFGGRF